MVQPHEQPSHENPCLDLFRGLIHKMMTRSDWSDSSGAVVKDSILWAFGELLAIGWNGHPLLVAFKARVKMKWVGSQTPSSFESNKPDLAWRGRNIVQGCIQVNNFNVLEWGHRFHGISWKCTRPVKGNTTPKKSRPNQKNCSDQVGLQIIGIRVNPTQRRYLGRQIETVPQGKPPFSQR